MSSNARAASLLVLLQLGSRLVTFSLNQALLSYTTPAAFGTATIQLEPLLNTVLFLCREGIRGALARQSQNESTSSSQSLLKISLVPLALGVPLSTMAFWLYARNTSPAVYGQNYFATSVILYAISTIVELASEPFFNKAQIEMNIRLRVSIEGSAVIARAIATLLVVWYGREKVALLAFASGQIVYASFILLRYLWHYRATVPSVSTREASSDIASSSPTLSLAYAMTKQSFVKQVLTEGDKLIVSRISPIEDQGGYGLALNYGSLVARILFQPLEESSRLYYSRKLGTTVTTDLTPDSQKRSNPSASSEACRRSFGLLEKLLKLQIYLSLIFLCFCPFYTTPLLYHLLRGSSWMKTSAPALLRDYLFLLPLLGLNGILEAFVQAVADPKQLGRMSTALLIWSTIYCATVYVAVTGFNMREEALILANGVSMSCRILYSLNYIKRYSNEQASSFAMGKLVGQAKYTIVACIFASLPLSWSYRSFLWQTYYGFAQHLLTGIISFAACAIIGLYTERHTIKAMMNNVGAHSQHASKTD